MRSVVLVVTTTAIVLLALALTVFKSGVWLMPNLAHQFAVSQSLTGQRMPESANHYLFHSYLQPALFGSLGGQSLLAYAIYCGITTVVFFLALAFALITTHGPTWKLFAVITFPVVMVPFYWIGMDGLTLLLALAVTLALGTRWSWLLALLLSWQHFEQAVVAFLILAITLGAARRTGEVRRVAVVLVALLIGKAALIVYFHVVGVDLAGGRIDVVRQLLPEFLAEWRGSWPIVLWSLCGAGWIALLVTVRQTWPALVAVPFVLLTLLAASDQTRVGSIILFPTLVYWVFLNRPLWRELPGAWIGTMIAVHLLVPFVYVWAGIACGSVRGHTRGLITVGADVARVDTMRPFLEGVCPSEKIAEVVRRLAETRR